MSPLDMTPEQVSSVAARHAKHYRFWSGAVRSRIARRIRDAGFVPTPRNTRRVHEALIGGAS